MPLSKSFGKGSKIHNCPRIADIQKSGPQFTISPIDKLLQQVHNKFTNDNPQNWLQKFLLNSRTYHDQELHVEWRFLFNLTNHDEDTMKTGNQLNVAGFLYEKYFRLS